MDDAIAKLVLERLGRLETKIDKITEGMAKGELVAAAVERLEAQVEKQDARLLSLEAFKVKAATAVGAVALVASLVWAALLKMVD